jgi:RimJ/RimL family protein N-acetyltransferase
VLERLGFVKEAHLRENYFVHGGFVDTAIYSLLVPPSS